MSIVDRMAGVANRFFASDFFTNGVLTRASTDAFFDPVTGVVSGGTAVNVSVRVLFEEEMTKSADGSLISMKKVTMDRQPEPGDRLTVAGETTIIDRAWADAPHGTALVYYATVTR